MSERCNRAEGVITSEKIMVGEIRAEKIVCDVIVAEHVVPSRLVGASRVVRGLGDSLDEDRPE